MNNSQAVAPRKIIIPFINRKHLADFFGLETQSLVFAIAETHDDDCGVNITPVIAILGKSEYISLPAGKMKTTALAHGVKQDLYHAIVIYNKEKDDFTFKSTVGSCATISATTLTEKFGKGVICR